MSIIDGKVLSERTINDLTSWLKMHTGDVAPKLVIIQVGHRMDSLVYIRNKTKAAERIGILVDHISLEENVSEEELYCVIDSMNTNKLVHGIIIQLPLPEHFDASDVVERIDPSKDVDCLTHINIGRLMSKEKYTPCTAKAIMELIVCTGVDMTGKHAVVVGRSNIVGLPISILLQKANATVTLCHSHTKDLQDHVSSADILVVAVGKPEFIKGAWVKRDSIVIDVGINSIKDVSRRSGYRLVGDIEFESAKERAKYITPVPGGVGPMTVAKLMENVIRAYCGKMCIEPPG